MATSWIKNINKLNTEFRQSIIWTIDYHSHLLLINKHGDIIFPKNFDLTTSNPNKNKLIITNKIDLCNSIPIPFYSPPTIRYESSVIKYNIDINEKMIPATKIIQYLSNNS